jgi:hypothetical protein
LKLAQAEKSSGASIGTAAGAWPETVTAAEIARTFAKKFMLAPL